MRLLSADVGGTFTDLVLLDGDAGRIHVAKFASTPGRADAVTDGIAQILQQADLAVDQVNLFVHGFTVGTNAFLMRRGARCAMVVTEGFRDVLEIGNQQRPHSYRLDQTRPAPVIPRSRVVEAAERVDAGGEVVVALSETEAARVADAVAALDPEAVAVCLTFGHLYPEHERAICRAVAERLPGVPIYAGSMVNPQIEEFPRAATTAVAAYVGPVVDDYVRTLESGLEARGIAAPLRLMRNDGGIATPRAARDNPATMLLSGPAGGVIAGAAVARQSGIDNLVTFDMGGTSADFSLIVDGEPRRVPGRTLEGQPLRVPTLDMETISAGGGSIARVDLGGGLRVGPHSAGAEPGPACYGLGGEDPTITDAAVVLGLLGEADFLGGTMTIAPGRARDAVETRIAKPLGLSVEEAAFGIIEVANASMIQAIRTLSVERGFDVRDFALLAFGGAGPLYAPFMARELGMREVVVPAHPGVFAALGLLLSDIRHTGQMPFQCALADADPATLRQRLGALHAELDEALERDGVAGADRRFSYAADLRCVGQFHELLVPLPDPADPAFGDADALAGLFHDHHETAYGHADRSVPVEFVNLRMEAYGHVPRAEPPRLAQAEGQAPEPSGTRKAYLGREVGHVDCALYARADLLAGHVIGGPAILSQHDSTTLVLAGQTARVDPDGTLRISADEEATG